MAHTGARDFDFLIGDWRVQHRRLKERLVGCTAWEDFDGSCAARPILGGQGNIDDNWLNLPAGAYCATTVRAFDPVSRRWAIWWLDARTPHTLDVPVTGGFENGVGAFHADDTLNNAPIKVRFLWKGADGPSPRWEQAFSSDKGAHWETNWIMQFDRSHAKEV